jgi:hypothetical protein
MGIVYEAWQVSLKRLVALKMIGRGPFATEAELRRFRTEVEAAAKLDHPNIVTVYEVGEHESQPYISMKLVEGGSLAHSIEECGRQYPRWRCPANSTALCNPRVAARLVAKVARAVHCAHMHGVLHRDLKPGNILIDAQGEPQVADFGLARLLDRNSSLTQPGEVLGTPQYMAPEQASGKPGEITNAADIYSLGAILYEVLTGQPPFKADTPLQVLRQTAEQEPKRPSALGLPIDRDLETICLKCLEKEPQKRYRSAEAVAEDLERWLKHEAILARPTNFAEHALKWTRRNPATAMLASMAMGGVIVLAAFGVAHWFQWRKTVADARSFNQSLRRATDVDWPMRDRDLSGSRYVRPATKRSRIEDYAPAGPTDGVGLVFVGNLSGGKELEIVAQRSTDGIGIFSANGVLISSIPLDAKTALGCLGDVNGDGKLEIITGREESGGGYAIEAYDPKGERLASALVVRGRGDMISPILAGDFDHDGKCEILAAIGLNPLRQDAGKKLEGRRGIVVIGRGLEGGPYDWGSRMSTDIGPYLQSHPRVGITTPGQVPRLIHGSRGPHNGIEGHDSSFDGTSYAFCYALPTGGLLWRREFQGRVLFASGDIRDVRSFAARLANASASDPLSQYLRSRMAPGTQVLLSKPGTRSDNELEQSLVRGLNMIIQGGSLYSSNRFGGITLPAALLGSITNEYTGKALAERNRQLLVLAYPNELSSENLPGFFDANVLLPDLNGDGIPEIVAITSRHGESEWVDRGVGAIREIDPDTGNDRCVYPINHLAETGLFGDLNGDGKDEIIVGSWDGTNGWLHEVKAGMRLVTEYSRPGAKLIPQAICDLDGDGNAEVVVVVRPRNGEDSVLILDHLLRKVLWERAFGGNRISQVMVVDLRGDGSRDILVTAGNQFSLLRAPPDKSQSPTPQKP